MIRSDACLTCSERLTSAQLTARQGPITPKLTMMIKVIDQPLTHDPDTAAYVTLIVEVANTDGTAASAAIALSFSAAKTL